jgi:AcrR family transcriptional regulator
VACFEEHGYDATTTALIARRARIAVGTLYAYFPDKRIILLELLADTMRAIADHVVQGLDPEAWRQGDPRQHVRSLIDAVFHARTFQPGVQRILWERYFKDPDFRTAVEAIESEVRGAMQRLVTVLKQEGRVRVRDGASAAFVVYTAVEWSAARLMLGSADEKAIEAAVEAASDMVSRFLFPEG